jgi:hypothetical protein
MSSPDTRLPFTEIENISKLKDILTKFGLLEDECIKAQIRRGTDTSNSSICEFEVEPIGSKTYNTPAPMSLKAFQDAVRDEYLNPAVKHLNLDQLVSDSSEAKETTTITFKSDKLDRQFEFRIRYVCIQPCSISPTGCCRYG